MDWKECCNRQIAKEIKADSDMADSLIESSANKFESAGKLERSNVTASSKVSLAYDSLRELLEALSIKKGHKIYNHECYTAFLKEIIGNSALGDEFDSIRKIRNAVNYYGKKLNVEEAAMLLKAIKGLIHDVYKYL